MYLITPHARFRVNSQNTNIDWFAAREVPELTMHMADAQARGIPDGAAVMVFNDKGKIIVPARVGEEIMPGVVCLPAGAWLELSDDGVDRGGCPNMLTST